MRASVIISTYNMPDWLEKVLCGYAAQTTRDFELLVADDGSTAETAERIDLVRRQSGLNIRHVWHEKRGFRKCAILNRAIVEAGGDYLIFSDGDCVPRADFVATHLRLARPRTMLSGGAVRLPMALSQLITCDDVRAGRATDLRWLLAHGLPRNRKLKLLLKDGLLPAVLDWVTTTRPTWNGGNSSAWKADIVRVNGYDERMEHGGLDREMGERLQNANILPVQIRHRAVCVHLDHSRSYIRADAREQNRAIRRATQRTAAAWTGYGIQKVA